MKRYLLDTNIISELGKPSPHPNIVNFVSALDTLWLSIITVHELKYGLNLLPEGNRRLELEATIGAFIDQQARFIIPIQDQEAEAAADLRAMVRKIGKPCHLADSLIAGTAKAHDLTIVTRNEKDFKYFGIEVENPWF